MDAPTPYLSVVATSRNDDHGANLKRRMQTFVNAFISQCKKHDLNAELILVEWNPPADRPRLAEALHWPADTRPCQVRIIEVPNTLHKRLKHSDALPLFQMIGKNVGIRRARGQFILATNIDVILNDELMQFLKTGNLERGIVYRVDRTDVETDVPQDAAVEEQLAFCRTHLVRSNTRECTFPLLANGERRMEPVDIATPESGITIGDGWLVPLRENVEGREAVWRQTLQGAVIHVRRPPGSSQRLLIELLAGPAIGYHPCELQVQDEHGTVVAQGVLDNLCTASVALPVGVGEQRSFRLFGVNGNPPPPGVFWPVIFRVNQMSWEPASEHSPDEKGHPFLVELHRDSLGRDIVDRRGRVRPGAGWMHPEEGPSGVFRWARSGAEVVVRPQRRKQGTLVLKLRSGPGLGNRRFRLLVQDLSGTTLASRRVGRRTRTVAIRLPLKPRGKTRFRLVVEGGGSVAGDTPWVRDFQVFDCRWSRRGRLAHSVAAVWSAVTSPVVAVMKPAVLFRRMSALVQRLSKKRQPELPVTAPLPAIRFAAPLLHLNACGDFTLMARENWFDLRGYAELEIFSLHIDSLICYSAHYSGLKEVVLPRPMRLFHIEHSVGSGWTPEGDKPLQERMARLGIPVMSSEELQEWTERMQQHGTGRLFNDEAWGFAHDDLPETRPGAPVGPADSLAG